MAATASFLEVDMYKVVPLSLSSLCAFSSRPSSSKTLSFAPSSSGHLRLLFRLRPRGLLWISHSDGSAVRRRVITAVAQDEPDLVGEGILKEEVDGGQRTSTTQNPAVERQQKVNKLQKRIIFGLAIGIGGGIIVLAGGWIFTVAVGAAVLVCAREYFKMVTSHGMTAGMTPPPRYVSQACSVICALMPVLTLYFGQIDVAVTFAAFFVAIALLLQRGNPHFAQLSSAVFGLFYCGYLPCFWVKLRCGISAPALNTSKKFRLPNTSLSLLLGIPFRLWSLLMDT